jgi:hypothetical protein
LGYFIEGYRDGLSTYAEEARKETEDPQNAREHNQRKLALVSDPAAKEKALDELLAMVQEFKTRIQDSVYIE